jgi:hypothetical protein
LPSFTQLTRRVATAFGNAQTTPTGNLSVDWGELGYISEFSPTGQLLFNARLPAGVSTYRAYPVAMAPGDIDALQGTAASCPTMPPIARLTAVRRQPVIAFG